MRHIKALALWTAMLMMTIVCASAEQAWPDELRIIEDEAFCGAKNITELILPQSIESIGWKAFSGCSELVSVVISQSVKEIGNSVFSNCTSLTDVTLPQGLESVVTSMFYRCSSLETVVIPQSVQSIGSYAFKECTALTSVTIPQSVSKIGTDAFAGCPGLTLCVVEGSAAEQYAKDNGIAYIYPEEPEEEGVVQLNDVVYDLDWFDYKSFYTVAGVKAGKTFTLTDLMTALSFDVYVQSAGYHADVEPLTAEDTATMMRIYGVERVEDISYIRRPMVATVGPVQLVCSMYGEAHGSEDIGEENGYDGQFCVHFRNSTTSGSQEVLEENQAPIDKAVIFVKAKGSEVRTSP
ncbi:MAG: leucine-rich repeat domain-containing protein [Clostridia bacterium]|nr:leucine-rich repeat domain-containing protein [Clostridia bacterium]